MPKIPTYESRLSAAGGVTPYRINERMFLPAVRGASEIGSILQRRGEALVEEYDAATALGAYNRLRDSARTQVGAYLQREGTAARGIQDEYDAWYTDESQKIAAADLTVARQRDLFSEMSDRRRAADLDVLARHEAGQHGQYKKQVVAGLGATLQRDILAAAFDEPKQAGMLDDYFAALERLYPGRDMTADKVAAAAEMRAGVARRLIAENPEFAAEYIERYRADLAGAYPALKQALAAAAAKNRADAAIAVLQTKYGDAHELKIAEALHPANWEALGLHNNDEAGEVAAYFRAMQTARDYTEERVEKQKKEQMQAAEQAILLQYLDPDTPRTLDIHAAYAAGRVSDSFYKWINSAEARAARQDDFALVDEIWEDTARSRYDEARQKITAGLTAGRLKPSTAVTLGKHVTDRRYGLAMTRLSNLMRPAGLFDKFANDKQLKLDEALESVRAISAATDKPIEEIVADIARGYVDSIFRSARNFRTPRYLDVPADMTPAAAKMSVELLEDARRKTAAALAQGRITEAEYLLEMNNIDTIMDTAREYGEARQKSQEIEDIRKNAVVRD